MTSISDAYLSTGVLQKYILIYQDSECDIRGLKIVQDATSKNDVFSNNQLVNSAASTKNKSVEHMCW